MFKYSLDNKRYHTLNYFYKTNFGFKIKKISLNGGFSCPNMDGTKGYGGCIYCSKSGSGEFAGNVTHSLVKQFYEVKEVMDRKWPNGKYIGYFQARSNTYAPLSVLKEKYEAILSLPDVMGLAIATRCDCISDEVLDYLGVLSKKYYIVVELGLQSIWEETGKFINRGHTLFEFTSCVKRLREMGINVVIHLINGLPNETLDMMLESAKFLNTLDIQGVKFHTLMVLKDTPLEKLYNKGDIKILSKDEYIDIVIRQLEVLDPKIVIHRIISDADIDNLISPKWIVKKVSVMNDIDKEMVIRDTYQGKLFGK